MRPHAVPPHTVAEAAAFLGVPAPRWAAHHLIRGITHDSRGVEPGDLYAALPGAQTHGARFAADVVRSGAVAGVTDPDGVALLDAAGLPALVLPDPRARLGPLAGWIYGDPAADATLLGVTGTNGKTTTTYLLDGILRAAGRRTGLIGTIATRVGDETLPSIRTTPEAPELHALLAVMRERGADAVAMEVSSHALALGRTEGMVFDVAVFTNLGQDHLDFHRDLEDYFAAKASLFHPSRARLGVVNVDDPYGARLAGTAGVPIVTVSPGGRDADWRVTDLAVESDGATTTFVLAGPGGIEIAAGSPLVGDFNVANAALAGVACVVAGLPPEAVTAGLRAPLAVPGRMESVLPGTARTGAPLGLVDYAHTPDAIGSVLSAVRAGVPGRLAVVLGAGGDRDRGKRAAMGAAAALTADRVLVTDDNPRSEDPAQIRSAVLAGALAAAARRGPGSVDVAEVADRAEAIRRAVAGLASGDAVVVLGKGHETGQEVAGEVRPFDDRVELRAALESTARESTS